MSTFPPIDGPQFIDPRRVRDGQDNLDLRPAPLSCVTIQGLLINERVNDALVPLAISTLTPAMEKRVKILYEIAQWVARGLGRAGGWMG